jgi:hypothetical protein
MREFRSLGRNPMMLGLQSYFSAAYIGNLFLENDQISIKTNLVYSEGLAKSMASIYGSKIDKKFLKYLSKDLLAYSAFSFNTENLLNEIANISRDYCDKNQFEWSEEITLYIDFLSIILDEEGIGDLITGDAMMVLNDIALKEVSYTSYEYDENFQSTKVTKTKEELSPEFTFMMGSKNERFVKGLLKLGVKHELLISKNSYYMLTEKFNEMPFAMFLAYKDDILFATSSPDQLANVIRGKAETKLEGKHKKLIKKNIGASYINMGTIAEKFIQNEKLDRDLRFLKDIQEDLQEAFLISSIKNGNINTDVNITIPEGSNSSAHYLLNLVDKVIAHDQKH